jgi:outer membrane autotransporter protein
MEDIFGVARLSGDKPQAKTLSEGYISGLGLLADAGALIADAGMRNMVNASAAAAESHLGSATFGAVSVGTTRYESGSHVDTHSYSLMAGISFVREISDRLLAVGAFLEYGSGSYDTFNSFPGSPDLLGDGDTRHIGGGILARLDLGPRGTSHVYTEASVRLGTINNKYNSINLRHITGNQTHYETDSRYYGFHLGVGYEWRFNNAATLDVYGKYFYTRMDGDSVTLSTGEPVSFDAVVSSRSRIGARISYELNEHLNPYAGAAWEYEFDGKVDATAVGKAIQAPSIGGSTGLGELGVVITPSTSLPWTLELGVQGYTGKRRGVTGNFLLKIEF